MRTKNKRRRRRRINRKLEIWLKISGFLILCLVCAGIALWYFLGNDEYSMASVTKISLVGYDGKGQVKAEIDESMLLEQAEETEAFRKVLETTEIGLSKVDNLSNGEQVEIYYTYDEKLAEELKVRISDSKTTFTVEQLPQAKEISLTQLFEDVELVLEGISPALTAQVVNSSEHPYIKTMDFVIRNPKKYYQKGDTIVVEALFDEQEAIEYQYMVEEGELGFCKEYPIVNMDSYIMDSGRITEEMLNIWIEEGVNCFSDANEYGLRIFSEAGCMPIWINKKTTFEWRNPYVISAYFNAAKESAYETAKDFMNDIKIVYGVTLTQADGVSCEAEIVVRFNGIMEKADGTIDMALENGSMISASHKDKFIKDIVRNTYSEENYESVKILE